MELEILPIHMHQMHTCPLHADEQSTKISPTLKLTFFEHVGIPSKVLKLPHGPTWHDILKWEQFIGCLGEEAKQSY